MRHNEGNQAVSLLRADLHQTLNDSAGIIGIIFSARVQPAVNSFSRVARSRVQQALVAGWYSATESAICYPTFLASRLCRQRNLLLTHSCRCAKSFTTRPPDLFAASNRW